MPPPAAVPSPSQAPQEPAPESEEASATDEGGATSVMDTSATSQPEPESEPAAAAAVRPAAPQMEKWRELRKNLFSQINVVATAGGGAAAEGGEAERMAALEDQLAEMDQAYVSKAEEAEEYEKRLEEMAAECSEYREKMIHYQQVYEE